MGFVGKLFGREEEEKVTRTPDVSVKHAADTKSIPSEKVGLDGEFDESGLAKRVAKALDDADVSDNVGLWIAQRGSVVVLKYNEDAKPVLSKAVDIAKQVEGATAVETVPNA